MGYLPVADRMGATSHWEAGLLSSLLSFHRGISCPWGVSWCLTAAADARVLTSITFLGYGFKGTCGLLLSWEARNSLTLKKYLWDCGCQGIYYMGKVSRTSGPVYTVHSSALLKSPFRLRRTFEEQYTALYFFFLHLFGSNFMFVNIFTKHMNPRLFIISFIFE